jgi:hypothetical protein
MNVLYCNRCGAECEREDNYCRRCGHQLTITLPAVRASSLPVRSSNQALPPSLVGSVALLAVGTGLEWLARRFANNALQAAGRAIVARENPPRKTVSEQPRNDVTVNEFLYVRKVQLRR